MKKRFFTLILLMCALTASAQDFNERRGFKGMLNNEIPVEVVWRTALNNGEWVNTGYIYYPKSKNSAPVLIIGERSKVDAIQKSSDNLEALKFTEYQPDGRISGHFTFTYCDVEGDCQFYHGSWTDVATGDSLPMTQMEALYDTPLWAKEIAAGE